MKHVVIYVKSIQYLVFVIVHYDILIVTYVKIVFFLAFLTSRSVLIELVLKKRSANAGPVIKGQVSQGRAMLSKR